MKGRATAEVLSGDPRPGGRVGRRHQETWPLKGSQIGLARKPDRQTTFVCRVISFVFFFCHLLKSLLGIIVPAFFPYSL